MRSFVPITRDSGTGSLNQIAQHTKYYDTSHSPADLIRRKVSRLHAAGSGIRFCVREFFLSFIENQFLRYYTGGTILNPGINFGEGIELTSNKKLLRRV